MASLPWRCPTTYWCCYWSQESRILHYHQSSYLCKQPNWLTYKWYRPRSSLRFLTLLRSYEFKVLSTQCCQKESEIKRKKKQPLPFPQPTFGNPGLLLSSLLNSPMRQLQSKGKKVVPFADETPTLSQLQMTELKTAQTITWRALAECTQREQDFGVPE